jgi:ferritin-like metal-binding protein YciE
MKLSSLEDLFTMEIQDLYSAENQLLKALPKMAKSANSPLLKQAFEKHLRETEMQVQRLDQLATELNIRTEGKKCKAMEGLIEEGEELIKMGSSQPSVLDAGLIGAAQRVEHYEIAAYGCARTYANMLGYTNATDLLQQTLDEETMTDQNLTQLAEDIINIEAERGR